MGAEREESGDMARKDNRGRNLRTGERQREDGRYEYRYADPITGKRASVYHEDLAELRQMEKNIQKDLDDGIQTDTDIKKMSVNASKEHRKPEFLPTVSAHTLRHTGCTRMAERGMDVKVLQYIMSHANIDNINGSV